ncbi:putative transporter SVOPL isoform X3 [Balaenoptera ricei]|nr:putative transporter SVOPL isoform X3 [Balaenoptera ricei]
MEIMLIAVVPPVIRCEWQLENWQVALVTTMVFFGYMVFSILFGLLADRYGRWKILLISFLWGAHFSLLTSFSPSYIWFVFLRTMVGCGVSGHAQGLIRKTEFLPTKYRGYMLPLSQVFWLAGSLLVIGLASVVIPTIGWRWLIRITSIPGVVLTVAFMVTKLMGSLLASPPAGPVALLPHRYLSHVHLSPYFIPESARFNVSTGNTQAALVTLERIAKMNRSVLLEGKLVEPILEKRGRFTDLLDAKYLWTTLQIWVVWLGIYFAYYGVILASAELLERDLVCGSRLELEVVVTVGVSEESQSPCHCQVFAPSDYQTMIISTIGEIALNPLNIPGINFLGRQLSLSITMGCTALFFLLLNICTSSAGLIGFLFMLRALVASNFNTIYIYTAEVYPTTMRALGMGTSGSLCRIGAMVAPFISQAEEEAAEITRKLEKQEKKHLKKEKKRLAAIAPAPSENSSRTLEECEETSERPKKKQKQKPQEAPQENGMEDPSVSFSKPPKKKSFSEEELVSSDLEETAGSGSLSKKEKSFPKEEPVSDPEESGNKKVPRQKRKFSSKEEPLNKSSSSKKKKKL